MNTPKISVYITSHNYAAYLSEAIESVLRQSMDSWELLLIDNGSTDETAHIMELYAGDPRIRLMRTEKMRLAAVANLALREARGEYLIRLDADDILDENILLVLANHLDRHPETALVFPDYYLMDEAGRIFAQERKEQLHYRDHVQDAPPNGACTMIRTKVIRDVGGYNEDLKAQDGFYIWSRIKGKHRCDNINIPLFYYRRHGNNLTEDTERIAFARREIKKFSCKNRIEKSKPISAIIPCRQNYDIYPNFWAQELVGQSLLNIAIDKCINSDIFDKIIISSDTEDVLDVINEYNDKRIFYVPRSHDSTLRSRPLTITLNEVFDNLHLTGNGVSVLCYLQSPLTSTETLVEAIHTLLINNADSSFSAEYINAPLYKKTPFGLQQINDTRTLSCDFEKIYKETKNVFAFQNKNIADGSIAGSRSVCFPISTKECFHINSKHDMEIARLLTQNSVADTKNHFFPKSCAI